MNKIIKGSSIFLCVAVISAVSLASSCEEIDGKKFKVDYDHVHYCLLSPGGGYYEKFDPVEIKEWGTHYYTAGAVEEYDEEGNPITVQFIAAEVDGLPVFRLGHSSVSGIGENHGSKTLKKLYAPGTIVELYRGYVCPLLNYNDITFYYCGKAINLYDAIYVHSSKLSLNFYVPNERYAEFADLLPDSISYYNDLNLQRANVSYRLNADGMTEYYYVDYVEYGEQIVNIPPDPKREGYTFGGWYTEAECSNIWSFESAVPEPDDGEDFRELCLYAKWTKI